MVFRIAAMLLLVFGCSVPSDVRSAARAEPENRNVQRFATENFLPYIDLQRPDGGFYPALIRRVLADHGAQAEFVARPWERASKETEEGIFDGSFPYLMSANRARVFLFSDPLLTVPSYLFVRRDQIPGDPDNLVRQIKTTCYLRDSLLPDRLQLRVDRGDLAVTRVDDMAQCFRMLAAGRVDAVCAGIYNGQATLLDVFGSNPPIVAVGTALDNATLHMVWPRSNPQSESRRRAFNASLRKLRDNGEWARLRIELLPAADRAPNGGLDR